MKRWIHASSGGRFEAYKRKDIKREEYAEAIRVGKEVYAELHRRYPDVFTLTKPASYRSKSEWSDHLYVVMDTGVNYEESIPDYHDFQQAIDAERGWTDIIRNEILPDLGISQDDFNVSMSIIQKAYPRHYCLWIFDRNTHSEFA